MGCSSLITRWRSRNWPSWRRQVPRGSPLPYGPVGLRSSRVTIENEAGAAAAVEHLAVVHGKRRIVCLVGPEGTTTPRPGNADIGRP
jgi:hypothetical protein